MRKLVSFLPANRAHATISVLAVCMIAHFLGGAWVLSHSDRLPDLPVSLLGRSDAPGSPAPRNPFAAAAKPQLLTDQDRKTYKSIFSAIRAAQWEKVDVLSAQVKDTVLMGHAEAERLLHPARDTSPESLVTWHALYHDLPQASAMARSQRGSLLRLAATRLDLPARSIKSLEKSRLYADDAKDSAEARKVREAIRAHVSGGKLEEALAALAKARDTGVLKGLSLDAARWHLARGYFNAGDDKQALMLSRAAALHSGRELPGIVWTAGLAAWRLGEKETAARYFGQLAKHPAITGPDRSAAAFWAWRAHEALGNDAQAGRFLRQAAASPRSFYGILAREALESRQGHAIEAPLLTNADMMRLLTRPGLKRAVALSEVGETYLAQMELRQAYQNGDEQTRPMILSLGRMLGVATADLLSMNEAVHQPQTLSDLTVYPLSRWKPAGGYRLDPALIAAFIRQESGFNPEAGSPAGAQGLMQIMPDTARFMVARQASLSGGKRGLTDPEYNLTLGQAYLGHLMEESKAGTNLFFLAAAYNAGPGNLARWLETTAHQGDPLLFIESIPYPETRGYIEQVMANYWVYQQMSGQKLATASDILDGRWPSYRGGFGKPRDVEFATAADPATAAN